MKTMQLDTPTEARKFAVFTNFRESKRIRWTEKRHYSH